MRRSAIRPADSRRTGAPVLAACILALASASLRAEEPPARTTIVTIPFTVLIDGREAGIARARPPEAETPLAIEVDDLIALLDNRITDDTMDDLTELPAVGGLVDAASLAERGIHAGFTLETLEITITIDPDARPVRRLTVAGGTADNRQGALAPERFSAFFNSSLSVQILADSTMGEAALPVVLTVNPAVHLAGHVLETSLAAGLTPQWTLNTSYLRYVYDFRESALRLTVGDTLYTTLGFQSHVPIQGVSLYRNFSIDGRSGHLPAHERRIVLTEPSVVTVTVNGRVIQRRTLPGGRYDVDGFPLVRGINDVEISVERPDGRIDTYAFQTGFDGALLRPGAHDFSYVAGVPPYTLDLPWVLGHHRIGVSRRLVLGGLFQTDIRSQMLGVHGLLATRGGDIQLDAAGSRSSDNRFDGAASLRYQFRSNATHLLPVLGVTLSYTGQDFVAYGVRTTGDYPFSAGLSVGYRVGASLSTNTSVRAVIDSQFSTVLPRLSLSLGTSFGLGTTANLMLDASISAGGIPELKAGVRISSAPLDRPVSVSVSHDLAESNSSLTVQLQPSQPTRSIGISAGITGFASDPSNARTVSLSGRYTGYRLEGSLAQRYTVQPDGNEQWATSLQLGAGLAYAGGSLAVTRPVHGSFALITRSPKYGDVRVGVNPSRGGYAARADELGHAVLPSLAEYTAGTITVEADELPLGYDLGVSTFTVLPGYRSGHRITVGSPGTVLASGELRYPDGRTAALIAGTLFGETIDEPVSFFTNRNGVFELYALLPGSYTLSTAGGMSAQFVIPPTAEGRVVLGALQLRAPGTDDNPTGGAP